MKNIFRYIILSFSLTFIATPSVISQEPVKTGMGCESGNTSLSKNILTNNLKDIKISFNDIKEESDKLNNCITYLLNNEEEFDTETLPLGFTSYINTEIKNKKNIKNALYVNYLLDKIQSVDQLLLKSMYLPDKNYLSPVQKAIIKVKVRDMADKQLEYNTSILKKLVNRFGWFNISEFGEPASDNAWLIVQHSDHDIDFQKNVLINMYQLSMNGQASKSHYAYLYDRVAVNEKRLQRYGTQGECHGNSWTPFPVDNQYQLDKLRHDVGLDSIADYKKTFNCERFKK